MFGLYPTCLVILLPIPSSPQQVRPALWPVLPRRLAHLTSAAFFQAKPSRHLQGLVDEAYGPPLFQESGSDSGSSADSDADESRDESRDGTDGSSCSTLATLGAKRRTVKTRGICHPNSDGKEPVK